MWFYRREMKITWKDRVSNMEIIKKMATERNSYTQNQKERAEIPWTKECLENLALTRHIEGGKRDREGSEPST